MHQPTNVPTDTSHPIPRVDVQGLKKGTTILVETEAYIYLFTLLVPEAGIVQIETGDPRIESGCFAYLRTIDYDEPIRLTFSNGVLVTAQATSAEVSSSSETNSYSFKVF